MPAFYYPDTANTLEIYEKHLFRKDFAASGMSVFSLEKVNLHIEGEGNLSEEYSSDSFHVYGKYYMDWAEWIKKQ